jgi:hypothetical protein
MYPCHEFTSNHGLELRTKWAQHWCRILHGQWFAWYLAERSHAVAGCIVSHLIHQHNALVWCDLLVSLVLASILLQLVGVNFDTCSCWILVPVAFLPWFGGVRRDSLFQVLCYLSKLHHCSRCIHFISLVIR